MFGTHAFCNDEWELSRTNRATLRGPAKQLAGHRPPEWASTALAGSMVKNPGRAGSPYSEALEPNNVQVQVFLANPTTNRETHAMRAPFGAAQNGLSIRASPGNA